MSNYPDDIGQYIWHPNSPFFEEPIECGEEYESEGDCGYWEESYLCEWMW